MSHPQVPPDALARVEGAELNNLVAKVRNGGTLTAQERQTFTKLTEKYGTKQPGQPASQADPVPVSQDEGTGGQRVNRQQKLARVQVVGEWLVSGHDNRRMYQFAANRWFLASRSVDSLIADAKRTMSDPRITARSYFRALQVRRLTELYRRRTSGEDPRDPMEPLRELSKLLGLNEAVWDHLAGNLSAPFPAGEHRQVAVKVIDDRGNELLVVKPLAEAKG